MRSKHIAKLFFAVLLSMILIFSLAACGDKEDAASDEDNQVAKYKVAMEPTFPPFDTTDEKTGELTGFDYDLMNAIAADQGFELEWVNMGFDGLIPALQAGNIDIIASGMNATDKRKESVDFSDSYYETALVLAVKSDNKTLTGIDSLKPDMKLGAQIATTGADEANKLKSEEKVADVKIYNGVDVAFMDLKNGSIQGIINDKPVTEAYIAAHPDDFKIVGEPLNSESYGIAVKKGNKELLDKINAGLKNIKESGEFDKLYDKWIN